VVQEFADPGRKAGKGVSINKKSSGEFDERPYFLKRP
jgi:hypothetical protein